MELNKTDPASGGGTDLEFACLRLAIYQPNEGPETRLISSAFHLADLTYVDNPQPIVDLRNAFRDAGFVQAERELNEAYRRHDGNAYPDLQEVPQNWHQRLLYVRRLILYRLREAVYELQQVLFDWTCGWGADPARPLIIIGMIALVCTPLYWMGMHSKLKRSGLFLVCTGCRVVTDGARERVLRITVDPACCIPMKEHPRQHRGLKSWASTNLRTTRKGLRIEFRALRTALLFSLMSVFNIGFEGFNAGQWIRALQPREFDIRARGWMRTVSGLQSLFGVGLLALEILSYFGHPFE